MKMFCLFSNLHAVLNHLAALDPSNHDACFLVLNCLWLSLLERTLGALTFRLNYPVAYDHFNSERILQVKRKKCGKIQNKMTADFQLTQAQEMLTLYSIPAAARVFFSFSTLFCCRLILLASSASVLGAFSSFLALLLNINQVSKSKWPMESNGRWKVKMADLLRT